jgi:hypothetical protein
MLDHTRFHALSFLLFFGVLGISGCDGGRDNLAPSATRGSAAVSSSVSSRVLRVRNAAPTRTAAAAKIAPRDSAFSIYNNPTYGISFRYPRTYALEEPEQDEESAENSTVETQERLAAEQPGSLLVATVLIPDDAYPRTTFAKGTLQLAVNAKVTADVCEWLADPPDSGSNAAAGAKVVQGITFHWRESVSVEAGTTYTNRNYAGFSNGTCYEFFLEISSTASDEDSSITEADVPKIIHPFEKIVTSLQFYAHRPEDEKR